MRRFVQSLALALLGAEFSTSGAAHDGLPARRKIRNRVWLTRERELEFQ